MGKDSTLTIRIDEGRKSDWKEHAYEEGYNDLTTLVVQSVEDRISSDTGEHDVGTDLEQLTFEMESLREEVSDVSETAEQIEQVQSTATQLEETAEHLENVMKQQVPQKIANEAEED
jgi:hypothetical protein